jgi:hypothetical protein
LENLDALVSLASSKLNSTSERFQSQLRRQLSKFGKVLQKVDLGDVKEERKRVDEIALLDEGEIEEVQRLVSALIVSKQNRPEDEEEVEADDNGVGDNARRRMRRTRRLRVSDIVELVKCKANHVSEEAVEVIERVLGSVKRCIESCEVQSIYVEGYEQERFEGLNDSEIRRSQIVV